MAVGAGRVHSPGPFLCALQCAVTYCNRCIHRAAKPQHWALLCADCEREAPPALIEACKRAHREQLIRFAKGPGRLSTAAAVEWMKPFVALRQWARKRS